MVMTSEKKKKTMAAGSGGPSDNKNTLKKTKFDLRIVQSYLFRAREERPLLSIPVGELDEHLSTFIRTHRKPDGTEYEAGTLRGILGSLDRHFEKSGYPHAIYRSKETKFKKTVSAMRERQSYLRSQGRGANTTPGHQAEPLSERDIERLYATGAIGLHSPTALLHMLFFNMGLHFSLRTLEQHALRWGDIALKSDPQGRKYLEHTKKLGAGGRGGGAQRLHPGHTMRMQIYESPEQPDRDVVKAYEKYAGERPDKMKAKDAPFYLTPQPDHRPGYARWFKNMPVGEARIRGIMKHLKMAAAGLTTQQRGTEEEEEGGEPVNGARSNGHAMKKEEEEAPCMEPDPCGAVIKEEWEEPVELGPEEKNLIPGRGLVTFHDVAAYFSANEWRRLEDWQKELYRNVMREIHAALEGMGYKIMNGDVLLKIRDEQERGPDPGQAPGGSITPDILLRIRHDSEGDAEEPEEEQDASSPSLPGFDPDLSVWSPKETNPPEDGKEQTPPSDPDADIISLSQPSFSSYREPLPGISTLCVSTRPRPGKRKRRPPQRRSYEQMPDSEDDNADEGDPKPRLPRRKLPAEGQDDCMSQEKIFQCDLCERTFSDRTTPLGTLLSCPQCGGTLNQLSDTFSKTINVQDTGPNLGFPCHLQDPVG
ncbi:uncharacterized protein LOC130361109 [Hyla sarda]|uniref:uncharacterized protein LOC130361109 n=1 Tax=Hyla sarda TaxID=327740 RepID=UPI0024C27A10|nr:uncharacterized protein LOC130361109 [Hyla sarda]